MEAQPNGVGPSQDPQLQQILQYAVLLGEGMAAATYDEHKRRHESGEPPESYFKTEEELRVVSAGQAKLLFPERDGFESAKVQTRPAVHWPDNGVLTVRHSVKPEKNVDEETLTSYQIAGLGSALLTFTVETDTLTERNFLLRARKGEGDHAQFHEDWAVHLEIVNLRLAGINSARFYAHKKREEQGLNRGSLLQANNVLNLLAEGVVQVPNGQQ